jgi:hypothetical protein
LCLEECHSTVPKPSYYHNHLTAATSSSMLQIFKRQ